MAKTGPLRSQSQMTKSKIQNRLIWILSFVISHSSFTPSFAAKTGANFLKAAIGARAAGMGQAVTAASQGTDALNWNVAGLANSSLLAEHVRPHGFSFSHQVLFQDTHLNHLGLSFRTPKGMTWGLNVIRVAYPSQERRDSAGKLVAGKVESSDLSVGVAVADRVGTLSWGSQFKIIRQTIDGRELGQAVAMDLGLMSPTPIPHLSFGASVRNLGPQIKFDSQTYDLPLILSVGTAYQMNGALNVSLDLHSRPKENQFAFSLGTELAPIKTITLRAGYLTQLGDALSRQRRDSQSLSNFIGFTAGMGFRVRQFSLDYSVTPFGELGNTQNFTMATWFGGGARSALAAAPAPVVSSYQTSFAESLLMANTDRTLVTFSLPEAQETWWYRLKP